MAGIVLPRPLVGIQLPLCTNARSSSSLHSGKYRCGTRHCYSEWHKFPVYSTSGLISFLGKDIYHHRKTAVAGVTILNLSVILEELGVQ